MIMATRRKGLVLPYYQEHKVQLKNIIRDYEIRRTSPNLFGQNDLAIFNTLESGITKFALRYYQLEALFILDYLFSKCQVAKKQTNSSVYRNDDLVSSLLEIIDDENDFKAPFFGFEMATGSGKTMLMGACIYFLNKCYGINNFLIITPASTDIYQKTIRNFAIGSYESVWADETPFTFNLITGDDYTENLFYNESNDANIFIFNISKFGSKAINTEKTWESSIWRDDDGNTISIRQFLRDKKLVIITDEAHHAQTPKANQIIKKFKPEAVLEFTATAIEQQTNEAKKNQTIVYKYDIRKFLEDGHGKLVRAVALASENGKKSKTIKISESEKLKIITLFLIHLIKKDAVLKDPKSRELKPIAFVKVKNDTIYTQKIFDYIKNDLHKDTISLSIILEKVRSQDLEIINLIVDFVKEAFNNDLQKLQRAIKEAAKTAIFYHGKSDKETERKFLNIRKNEVEIVVYMQRLDEGIDLPNIYTMAVINDTITDFKTSVKQIIGRGVRLNKEKREFDTESYSFRSQSEKLHVICDQGKNFEEVILSIQKEFGLSDKYLSIDKPRNKIINKAKSDYLEGKSIPHIKADFKVRKNVELLDLIGNTDEIIAKYIEENCCIVQNGNREYFLRYKPASFFIEVDVFADEKTFNREFKNAGARPALLQIEDKHFKSIYGIVQKQVYCLPDTNRVHTIFSSYLKKINEISLRYYKIDSADELLAQNYFVNTFSFFYRNYVEKNYYELDFKSIETTTPWILKRNFNDYQIHIPEDQIENKKLREIFDRDKLTDLIKKQFHFYGYKNSIYDYVQFDSYTEKQLADYSDEIIKRVKQDNKPFWVRNLRNIYFTYGTKKYYPDFIMYHDGIIYVIETKGEFYSDYRKNFLLAKLNEIPGYRGLIIFSTQLDEMGDEVWDFDRFIERSEKVLRRQQSREKLVPSPTIEERFIKYLPVYSPQNALRKFIKNAEKVKVDGWLEVAEQKDRYPDTCFVVQVKDYSLFPRYRHNDWCIFDANFDPKEIDGKLVLIHDSEIEDNYYSGFTIRKIKIKQEIVNELFPRNTFYLEALNTDFELIILRNLIDESEAKIIGVEADF